MSAQDSERYVEVRGLFISAILDYFNGETSSKLMAIYEGGLEREVNLNAFFRGLAELPPIEKKAIELCRGQVLDIGAGVGRHSLFLQELGLSVCAIDISPEFIEIMKKRGVKDARRADLFTFNAGPFDTLLCIMNGTSLVQLCREK
jgi:2-polyprenyl-3-methyl-5-hydroxy-6-metoxy-1,4-benzoquinol methylase